MQTFVFEVNGKTYTIEAETYAEARQILDSQLHSN